MPFKKEAEQREYKFNVFDHENNLIGYADNFKEAKDMHKEVLPPELLEKYAGLDSSLISSERGAYPAFYLGD